MADQFLNPTRKRIFYTREMLYKFQFHNVFMPAGNNDELEGLEQHHFASDPKDFEYCLLPPGKKPPISMDALVPIYQFAREGWFAQIEDLLPCMQSSLMSRFKA